MAQRLISAAIVILALLTMVFADEHNMVAMITGCSIVVLAIAALVL